MKRKYCGIEEAANKTKKCNDGAYLRIIYDTVKDTVFVHENGEFTGCGLWFLCGREMTEDEIENCIIKAERIGKLYEKQYV